MEEEKKPERKYNTENLVPFAKGFDPRRNLEGKPEGSRNAKTLIKKWLDVVENVRNPITGQLEDLTQYDIIILAQLAKARAKDTQAFNALLDRLEGKPVQSTEITGKDGAPLQMQQITGIEII